MKKIKISRGNFTIVNSDLFEHLNQWKWYCTAQGYAARDPWIRGSGKDKENEKWIVRLWVDGKNKHIGCFLDIKDAVKKRNEVYKDYFGELPKDWRLS